MARSRELSTWITVLTTHLPSLSGTQARGLAWYGYGTVLAGSCAQTAVIEQLRSIVGKPRQAIRKRLRDFLYDAEDKRPRNKRRALDIERCFPDLFGWIVHNGVNDTLVLAMDASYLGNRLVVLSLSVCYRGCAIPVAWKIVPANRKGAWQPHWLRMLRWLHRETPSNRRVFVMSDSGISCQKVYRRIVRLNWHPILRITGNGKFRPQATDGFQPMTQFLPAPGSVRQMRGDAFKGNPLRNVTLILYQHPDHKDPWFLLTDLEPLQTHPLWYARRAWIEQQFRLVKRGGWQWQHTRRNDPARVQRLWLVLAVTTLIVLHEGGRIEDQETPIHLPSDPMNDYLKTMPDATPDAKATHHLRPRLVSLIRLGCAALRATGGAIRPTFRFGDDPLPPPLRVEETTVPP